MQVNKARGTQEVVAVTGGYSAFDEQIWAKNTVRKSNPTFLKMLCASACSWEGKREGDFGW